MELLYSVLKEPHACHLKTWGTAGYVLAELITTAEASHDVEGMEQVAKLAKEWCAKTLLSDSKKLAALCCVLVKVHAFDELRNLPTESHLVCGYHLARAGFLQLAERFLVSGLRYNEQEMPDVPVWRYHLELWTVRMRLGHWEDAEQWLLDTWQGLSTRTNDLPAGEFDFWKLSGEFGEFKLNLASLLSDCYIARGLYFQAKNLLEITIGSVSRMRDTYISATRVTLLSRLLNVQLHIEEPHHAAVTAMQLCRELQESKLLDFGLLDISWTVQEIISCVNELSKVGLPEKAYIILRMLKELDVDSLRYLREDNLTITELPKVDLIAYIDQRWNEVGSMLGAEDPLRSQHPLSELTINLTMQPLLFGITNSGDQLQVLSLPEGIPRPGSRVKHDPYIFPAPRSWTRALPVQKSKDPAAEDPEHVETEKDKENASAGPQVQDSVETAATREQQEAASEAGQSQNIDHRQVAKERKAANRKRRRDNLRMLMQLRKPPSDIPPQPLTVEEGRSESANVGEGLSLNPVELPVGELTELSAVEMQGPDSIHRWEIPS